MSGSGDLLELLLNPLHEEPSPARILVEVATEYCAKIEQNCAKIVQITSLLTGRPAVAPLHRDGVQLHRQPRPRGGHRQLPHGRGSRPLRR